MNDGVVLDVPAVVGICRRAPYAEAVLWTTIANNGVIAIPATVLAEARGRLPAATLDILDVILGLPNTVVPELGAAVAAECGALLAGVPDNRDQVAAAHAVIEAIAREWPVTTDRGKFLTALDERAQIDAMP